MDFWEKKPKKASKEYGGGCNAAAITKAAELDLNSPPKVLVVTINQ